MNSQCARSWLGERGSNDASEASADLRSNGLRAMTLAATCRLFHKWGPWWLAEPHLTPWRVCIRCGKEQVS